MHAARRLPLLALLLIAPVALATSAEYLSRDDSLSFIDEMVDRHRFDREALRDLFGGIVKRDHLFELMERPAEKKPWYQYRPIFVTEARAQAGVEFWERHREWLEKAEARYGVPAQMIVAIIGVETRYGGYTGREPVLDTLATFAFDYPKRARFFRRELEQYLLLTREESIDPREPKGSYAGAMGMPQFISSSYRHYAVDFDGDGTRDLFDSPADVIGSVANYFARHGWRPGEPVLRPARVRGEGWRELSTGLEPRYTLAELERHGVTNAGDPVGSDEKLSFLALETEDGHRFMLGLKNFYVITRYNRSALYAMATWELSELVQRLRVQRAAHDAP